ncbi:MAG TPA: GNAT family N-acetyltransferase [Ktedonobacteraceae bacterium]|jgi:ribosomal protein S18 acetylase RimI-like enzyme|nr:GNAT family N-acetyltransferase [Ktedonobacteraceae bacterium]
MGTVRTAQFADATGIARVHVDSWRTTYKGIFPDELLANRSYERREQYWQQALNDPAQITVVTEDETGKIVGFVTGGLAREGDPVYRGELYAIYILQEAQRHGLGRRLIGELARRLAERQIASMMLWVLANNPACSFYEAVGGQVIKQKRDQIGGAFYDELAYGWTDLSPLLHL